MKVSVESETVLLDVETSCAYAIGTLLEALPMLFSPTMNSRATPRHSAGFRSCRGTLITRWKSGLVVLLRETPQRR
jgi:hypothetical protein